MNSGVAGSEVTTGSGSSAGSEVTVGLSGSTSCGGGGGDVSAEAVPEGASANCCRRWCCNSSFRCEWGRCWHYCYYSRFRRNVRQRCRFDSVATASASSNKKR